MLDRIGEWEWVGGGGLGGGLKGGYSSKFKHVQAVVRDPCPTASHVLFGCEHHDFGRIIADSHASPPSFQPSLSFPVPLQAKGPSARCSKAACGSQGSMLQ